MTFDQMLALEPNWNSFGADPPDPLVVAMAGRFARLATEAYRAPDRTMPTGSGGVSILWKAGRRRVRVEVFGDGRAAVMSTDGSDEPRIDLIDLDDDEPGRIAGEARDYLEASP